MVVTAVMSVVVTCTYTVCHLLNFYCFLFLINVTCLDFQGNFILFLLLLHLYLLLLLHLLLLLLPPYSFSSFSMVLSPFFRPWSPLSSSSNLLSSLLLFSSCVHDMIQTASSHLHLGFCVVLFPLKHSSITALEIKHHPSLLYGQPTVSYYYCSTLFCVSRYL